MKQQERPLDLIDGIWPLEGFVKQKNADASIRYGFIGLGQGGSKIVDAFASIRSQKDGEPVYPCMIVNSNLGDIRSLKNVPDSMQFGLKGFEKGVGKDPKVGKQAFESNGEHIFNEISRIMASCEMIYVCASLGGGTGTGAINILVDAIADYLAKPVAAIVTLPVPDEVESRNAFNGATELVAKLTDIRSDGSGGTYRGMENLVILDNKKIIEEHLKEPEVPGLTWDFYSNYKVASIMHEWNVLTSLDSTITLDAADLTNHVLRTGSILTFAKKKINLDEIKSKEDLITQIISTYKGKNVLANGFDYQTDMRSMGLMVVMPKDRANMLNQDTLEVIRTRFKKELPNVNIYIGSAGWNSDKNAIIYTTSSMAGLPERAKNLRQEAEELVRAREERERQSTGFQMGGKLESGEQSTAAPARRGAGNPFGQATSAAPTVKSNPFSRN